MVLTSRFQRIATYSFCYFCFRLGRFVGARASLDVVLGSFQATALGIARNKQGCATRAAQVGRGERDHFACLCRVAEGVKTQSTYDRGPLAIEEKTR